MSDNDFPVSSDFYRLHGQLAEFSVMPCLIPEANVVMQEVPALDGLGAQLAEEARIEDQAQGSASWETHLHLVEITPEDLDHSLELICAQPSRQQAWGQYLLLQQALMTEHPLQIMSITSSIISQPASDGSVPAVLWFEVECESVGSFSALSSGTDFFDALRVAQTVLPEAELH
jgi:hypothetical protein